MKATTLSHRNPELVEAIASMQLTLDRIEINDHHCGYLVSSGKAHNYFIAPQAPTQPRYHDIMSAYTRPSDTKREIWKDWLNALNQIASMLSGNVDYNTVGLASRNGFNITVCGDVVVDGTRYKLNITKSRVDVGICKA